MGEGRYKGETGETEIGERVEFREKTGLLRLGEGRYRGETGETVEVEKCSGRTWVGRGG